MAKFNQALGKAITCLWKLDHNGNGFWRLSDGDEKASYHQYQSNEEGCKQALQEYLSKYSWDNSDSSYQLGYLTQEGRFLGYVAVEVGKT